MKKMIFVFLALIVVSFLISGCNDKSKTPNGYECIESNSMGDCHIARFYDNDNICYVAYHSDGNTIASIYCVKND